MTILMVIFWLSYETTSSPLFLGLLLSISAILPILIKRFLININLLELSMKHLMFLRIIIYSCMIGVSLFLGASSISFIILSILIGILSITLLSTFEIRNSIMVLEGKTTSNFSARALQTVIQVGAFSGAFIGSIILEVYEFKSTILYISLLDIAYCVFILIFSKKLDSNTPSNLNLHSKESFEKVDTEAALINYILLGIIGLHIATFNLTVPIVFQEINNWNVSDYGVASGFAGLGAFFAVFIGSHRILTYLFVLSLIIFDILFMFNSSIALIPFFCFGIGVSINSLRIMVRAKLINLVRTELEAKKIGSASALYYTLSQSLGSLVFGFLISYFSKVSLSQTLLPVVAISFSIFFVYSLYKRKFYV